MSCNFYTDRKLFIYIELETNLKEEIYIYITNELTVDLFRD